MSALGSSVISKSHSESQTVDLTDGILQGKSAKKFAPKKAPARRQTGVNSTQTATRSSIDRQSHSQTPQLQPVPTRVAASPVPSVSIVIPVLNEQGDTPAPTQLQRDSGPIRITIPSREPSIARAPSAQPTVPQKRTFDGRQASGPQGSVDISEGAASHKTTVVPPPASFAPPEKSSKLRNRPSGPSEATISAAPFAKRRKVLGRGKQTTVVPQDPPAADPNVALPTTETGDFAPTKAAGGQDESTSTQLATKRSRVPAAGKRKQRKEVVVAATAPDNVAAKVRKPRKPRQTRGAPASDDQAPGAEIEDADYNIQEESSQSAGGPGMKKPRISARNKGKQAMEDAAAAIVEDATNGSPKSSKKRGRRSRRIETPDEAQHVRIDVAGTKMSDLCKDGGMGQKSSADKIIRENERAAALKKKQQEVQRMMGQAADESASQAGDVGESQIDRLDRERREREEEMGNIVPQQHIVNGEIVIDTSSLRIDRHALAAAERNAEQLEYVEEDEYTRKVNNSIGLKRDKSGGWNEALVDLFYDGLRMFGTDFGMISKMFPGKTRHAIKLKFCKEEKENGLRIRTTLLGEVLPVELEEFQKLTGEEYEDPSVLEKDIEEDKRKLEEEQEQEKQAIEAARKERAEQAEAERLAAQGEESSSKENRRQRKRKSGKGKKRKEQGEKTEKAPRRTKARKGTMLEGIGDYANQQVALQA